MERRADKRKFRRCSCKCKCQCYNGSVVEKSRTFLEDGDWATANAYCDSILDAEPENANAYLYKLMAELKISHVNLLSEVNMPFDNNANYKKALRFADETFAAELTGYIKTINDRNENRRLQKIYNEGKDIMDSATTSETYLLAARKLSECSRFHDVSDLILTCTTKAEECRVREEEERIAREKNKENCNDCSAGSLCDCCNCIACY